MTPEEVELYKDAIKIGVPAIVGFLAGFVPYLIEGKKVSAQTRMERDKAKHELILNFSDAIAKHIGSSKIYSNYLITTYKNNDHAEYKALSKKYGMKMVENEENRTRAKALAGLLGKPLVLDALVRFDNSHQELVISLTHDNEYDNDIIEKCITKMKNEEISLYNSMSKLL